MTSIVVRRIPVTDGIEVVEAPQRAAVSLGAALDPPVGSDLHVHNGQVLVFGTPGVGMGRVGYLVTGWDPLKPGLLVSRVAQLAVDCPACQAPPARPNRTLRSGEAAAMLGVDVRTLRRWAEAGRVAHSVTAGGHFRYQEADILPLAVAAYQPARRPA